MNKQEMREKFEKNVVYLEKVIPPDDIYIFCEQTFMAALFFLKKYSDKTNITVEMLRDPTINKWVRNLTGFLKCREEGIDINLDLNLDSVDE